MPAQYQFTRDLGYPVAEVFEAIASPDRWRDRALAVDGEFELISHRSADGESRLEFILSVKSSSLPRAMRAFTPSGLSAHCLDRWKLADGGASGRTEMIVTQLPARQWSETTISALDPATCRFDLFGELDVAIPFAGRIIEQKVVATYQRVLTLDHEAILRRLDDAEPGGPRG